MDTATSTTRDRCTYLTVPQISRRIGVGVHTVLRWIHGGRLRAINTSSGHERPRYRVHEADLQVFLASLAVQAAPAQTPRRRRAPQSEVVEWIR